MDKLAQISDKQRQLQEELKKQTSFLSELENAIRRLRNDRKITIANISKIDGAMQAYSESVLLLRDEAKVEAAPNVSDC